MTLENFIIFRKKLQNIEKTSFGFKGHFLVNNQEDSDLIKRFDDSQIREIFYYNSNSNANNKDLKIGDHVVVLIDLTIFKNYYETIEEFIISNRYSTLPDEFYIFDLDYNHNSSPENLIISNFSQLQELIAFLRQLSTYEKEVKGVLELFFHKPDKVCSINIEYSIEDIKSLIINEPIEQLSNHVFEKSDKETRIKLFTNEMINLLTSSGFHFGNLLKIWNTIEICYRNTFQIYLSEFSFEKIKTSSQEYFHELTDRIYSTINKFSGYILAIPVAYVLLLRFFDFEGNSIIKDTILVLIGILYFIVIWKVLLNNLNNAFNTIEKDINRFLGRIENEENLSEITLSLKNQIESIIPSQKRKILLVRIVSILILLLTNGAYLYIYWNSLADFISGLFE